MPVHSFAFPSGHIPKNLEEFITYYIQNWMSYQNAFLISEDVLEAAQFFVSLDLPELAQQLSQKAQQAAENPRLFARILLTFVPADREIHIFLRYTIWHHSITSALKRMQLENAGEEKRNRLSNYLTLLEQIAPNRPYPLHSLARFYNKLGMICQELRYFIFSFLNLKESLVCDANYQEAYYNLGKGYLELSNEFLRRYPDSALVVSSAQSSKRFLLQSGQRAETPEERERIKKLVQGVNILMKNWEKDPETRNKVEKQMETVISYMAEPSFSMETSQVRRPVYKDSIGYQESKNRKDKERNSYDS